MDRSEYYSRLASIVVGSPCFVSVKGDRTIRESGDINVIVLPERGLAMGILAGLLEPRHSDKPGKEAGGHAAPQSLDRGPRLLLERMALYLQCGRLKFPSTDTAGLPEAERLVRGVLEDRRAEALMAEGFPALASRFRMADRLMLLAAPRLRAEEGLVGAARSVLLAALRHELGLGGCAADDRVVRRTAELIAGVGADPHRAGAVDEAAREILELIGSKTSPTIVSAPSPQPSAGAAGTEEEGTRQASELGDEAPVEAGCEIAIDEETAQAVAEVTKEMATLGIELDPDPTTLPGTARSKALIDQAVMLRTADILRRMRGSMRSYHEVLSDEGYAIDIPSVIQLLAGNLDERRLYYNYRKDRTEFDMVICLDRSASMQGERMAHAKGSTATLVRALELAGIGTAITAYDEVSTMVKPWEGRVETCALGDLEAGGGTSIAQALAVANGLLEQRGGRGKRDGRRQAIIVVSDGQDYYLERIAAQIAIAHRRGTRVLYIGIGDQCRRFLRIGAEHFRYDHSVIIDRSEQMGEALTNLARSFIREA